MFFALLSLIKAEEHLFKRKSLPSLRPIAFREGNELVFQQIIHLTSVKGSHSESLAKRVPGHHSELDISTVEEFFLVGDNVGREE